METPDLSWDMLRTQMRRPLLPSAWGDAGLWCIDTLEDILGADWAAQAWKRQELPGFIAMSWLHRQALLELLEFSLRLSEVTSTSGAGPLRRDLKRNLSRARTVGTQLQLEVAALGITLGARVELEVSEIRGYPADVVLHIGDARLVVECSVVHVPDVERAATDAFDLTSSLLGRIGWERGFAITGEIDAAAVTLEDIRADLDSFGVLLGAALGSGPIRFEFPWGIFTAVRGDGGLEQLIETPGHLDFGRHALGKIRRKVDQAGGSHGVWLRLDVRSGMWQHTPWSQETLATKSQQIAHLVKDALTGQGPIGGIVLTSGSCIMAGSIQEEVERLPGGTVGLRRAIEVGRARETVIIPLGDDAAEEAELWERLYLTEPAWLPVALRERGLPSLEAMFPPSGDQPPSTP